MAGLAVAGLLLLFDAAVRATPGLFATTLQSLAAQFLLAGLAVSAAWGMRDRPVETLGLGPSLLSYGQTLALVISTLGLSHAVYTVLNLTTLRDVSNLGELQTLLADASIPELALALCCLALAPSIGEELLCRGLLQRSIAQRWGAAPAIGISSAAFAALHFDPVHAMFAAPMGIQLGLAAHLGDSTRTPTLCHLANNSVAVTLAAFPWLLPPGSMFSAALGLMIWGMGWAALSRKLPPGDVRRSRPRGL